MGAKYFTRLVLFLSLLFSFFSCKGINIGGLSGIDGIEDLAGMSREEISELADEEKEKASKDYDMLLKLAERDLRKHKNSEGLKKASPFNADLQTLGLLEELQKGCEGVQDKSKCQGEWDDRMRGIFKKHFSDHNNTFDDNNLFKCDPDQDGVSQEDARKAQSHFNAIAYDLENISRLAKVLLKMASAQEIKEHEDALKSIPIEVAKKAIVNAKGPKLIVPKGTKDVVNKVKKKYDALEKVKTKLLELQGSYLHGNTKGGFLSFGSDFSILKDAAEDAIEEYEDMEMGDQIEYLKDNGYEVSSSVGKTLSGELTRSRTFLKYLKAPKKSGEDGPLDISDLNKYKRQIAREVEKIEKDQLSQIEEMTKKIFTNANPSFADNTDQRNSEKAEIQQKVVKYLQGREPYDEHLFDDVEEVVGWSFDPEMGFDLVKNLTTDYLDDNLLDEIKKSVNDMADAEKQKSLTLALDFFGNQDKLRELVANKDWVGVEAQNIGEVGKLKLGPEFQGAFTGSIFNNWKHKVCESYKNKECNLKTIFASSESFDKMDQVASQLAQMLNIDLGNPVKWNSETIHKIRKFLDSIEYANKLLMEQNESCQSKFTGGNYSFETRTDEDAINSRSRKNGKTYDNFDTYEKPEHLKTKEQ